MVVKHDSKRLLHKLKKRIKTLQSKEENARMELQAAVKKIHFLARDYRIKLALKTRIMENRIAEARKKSYINIIRELEDMIMRGISGKKKPTRRKTKKRIVRRKRS